MNCLKCGIEWPLTTKKKEKQKCDCGQKLSNNDVHESRTKNEYQHLYLYKGGAFYIGYIVSVRNNMTKVATMDGFINILKTDIGSALKNDCPVVRAFTTETLLLDACLKTSQEAIDTACSLLELHESSKHEAILYILASCELKTNDDCLSISYHFAYDKNNFEKIYKYINDSDKIEEDRFSSDNKVCWVLTISDGELSFTDFLKEEFYEYENCCVILNDSRNMLKFIELGI